MAQCAVNTLTGMHVWSMDPYWQITREEEQVLNFFSLLTLAHRFLLSDLTARTVHLHRI